jgi:hypothetical protein
MSNDGSEKRMLADKSTGLDGTEARDAHLIVC